MLKTAFILVVLINLALLVLCYGWRDTNRMMERTNLMLLLDASRPHPIHDASLTTFREPDGSLSIIVNGYFIHKIDNPCLAF